MYCSTKFWDASVTWNTDSPDFTPCFHQTALVYTPTLILVLATPFQVRSL